MNMNYSRRRLLYNRFIISEPFYIIIRSIPYSFHVTLQSTKFLIVIFLRNIWTKGNLIEAKI